MTPHHQHLSNPSIHQQTTLATLNPTAYTSTAILSPLNLTNKLNKYVISNPQLITQLEQVPIYNDNIQLDNKELKQDTVDLSGQFIINSNSNNKIDTTNKTNLESNTSNDNNTNYAANLAHSTSDNINNDNDNALTSTTSISNNNNNITNGDLSSTKSLLLNLHQNEIKNNANNLNIHPLFQPLLLFQQKPQQQQQQPSNQLNLQIQEQNINNSLNAALINNNTTTPTATSVSSTTTSTINTTPSITIATTNNQQQQQFCESKLQLQNINNHYQYRLNEDLITKSSYQLKRNQIFYKPY